MTNELYHHGILGMKWGVRRYQNPDGSLTLEGRRRYLKDAAIQAKKERKKDYKNRRGLSDDELQEKITRLEKEKRLKDLTEEDMAPGERFVRDVASSSTKKVANIVLTGAMLWAVNQYIKKYDDPANWDANGHLTKLGQQRWEKASYWAPKPKNK